MGKRPDKLSPGRSKTAPLRSAIGLARGIAPFRGLGLTAALLVGALTARAELAVGDAFPALDAFHLEGRPLPDTAGRVTVVDFWASWCAPCKDSFPAYAQLHRDFSPKGLLIVAVSVDEDAARYAAFLKQLAPPFAVARDDRHELVERVQVAAMPTSFLLDRRGRVRFVHHGFHGADTVRDFQREIDALLAEPPTQP